MAKHSYRNPWFKPHNDSYGPEFFTTDTEPLEYRGFQIFNRFKNSWELVKDGVCLTQRAGGKAMRSLVDALLGDANDHPEWLVDRARQIAEAHGVTFEQKQAA